MSTTNEDISAAIASLNSGEPAARGSDSAEQPATPPTQPVEQPASQPRDQSGRFTSASPTAPAASGGPAPEAGTGAATPTPAAPPVAAPAAGTPAAPATPTPSVQLDPSKPPQGWSQASKDKWNTIPEDIRQEIIRREEAGATGVAKLKQSFEPAERLYGVAKQHEQYFSHIQVQPEQYFDELIQVEKQLSLGNPAQKMEMLVNLADQYGIPLRQTLDSAFGGNFAAMLQQAHQYHKTPPQVPQEVQQRLDALQAQNAQMLAQMADAEHNQFMSTPRPFYEEVKERMADLIDSGVAKGYEDAYEMAVWSDPAIRARALAQQQGVSQQNGAQTRQQIAAAAAAPSPAAISQPTVPENETTEDTVRRAIAASAGGV